MNIVIVLGSLMLALILGTTAYYNHWVPYWVGSAVAAGVFIWRLYVSWQADKASQAASPGPTPRAGK